MLNNSAYNIIGMGFRLAMSVITIPLLIRILGTEEYGLWILSYTIIAILNFSEAGLSISATVFFSKGLSSNNSDDLSKSITSCFIILSFLATGAAFALFFGASSLVSLFPSLSIDQKSSLAIVLQIGTIALWNRLMQQLFFGIEQSFQRFDYVNILKTSQLVLGNMGILIIAYLGGKIAGMMVWWSITSAVTLLAHIVISVRLLNGYNVRYIWDRNRMICLITYSMGTWLTILAGILFIFGDRLIVGAILGASVLSIYSIITDISQQINTLAGLSIQPLLPYLTRLLADRESAQRIMSVIKQSYFINFTVVIVIVFPILLADKWILHLLLNQSVSTELLVAFRLSILIYAAYSLNVTGFYVLLATNNIYLNFTINLSGSLIALGLIAVLSKQHGLSGAIIGNVGVLTTLLFIPLSFDKLRQIHHDNN